MSQEIVLSIDGRRVAVPPDRTILEAAEAAGIYIPHLCARPGLSPYGSCRLCTVIVNGRPQSACTQPAAAGQVVESDTEELNRIRRQIVEMLFVEGNHFCMFCEKSGSCELQALAYRFGITAPDFPFRFPRREVDASHPDLLLDRNRCILCARCVRASAELDGKDVFGFTGRGLDRKLSVDGGSLGETRAEASDEAADACPTGSLLRKRVGFQVPVGQRTWDRSPIGSDIEHESTEA